MRNKKLLSTVVAGALVATTMAMPVMAADESGSLDVDLTTKTGVLRVEVPTQMAIAVDQFEITQTGAQIASGTFDMVNKSEMAVKVGVTSTATLGTGINLVSGVGAVEASTGNDAWLAVAAKTAAGSYDDAATADKTENYYDLTEENANVKTFGSEDKAASQTFYLEKGTGAVSYALAIPKDNKASVSYAKFYELTEIATQPTDDDELQAEVDKGDVYVVVTANNGKDGEAVTKIAKGDTVSAGTVAGADTYYTAADEAAASVADGTKYVYASMGTAGEAAGFTYVGKLSNAKDTWTKDDIKKINIAYTITGVTGTKFNEVKNDCTYGLYKDAPKVVEITGTKITNPAGTTEYDSTTLAERIKIGSLLFQFDTSANDITGLSVTKILVDGDEYQFTSAENAKYTIATSDNQLYTLSGFTADSVSSVEVFYGENTVVKYTLN